MRGTTGNVVLLDRGTKIVGQIENGLLQGQNRVFVDWTRAETPNHVVITLNSPGTDELGRGGLPGAVDNHLWKRFGGALMLTLVQGGLNAGDASKRPGMAAAILHPARPHLGLRLCGAERTASRLPTPRWRTRSTSHRR